MCSRSWLVNVINHFLIIRLSFFVRLDTTRTQESLSSCRLEIEFFMSAAHKNAALEQKTVD